MLCRRQVSTTERTPRYASRLTGQSGTLELLFSLNGFDPSDLAENTYGDAQRVKNVTEKRKSPKSSIGVTFLLIVVVKESFFYSSKSCPRLI
jgi:hypothetical protein